MLAFDAVRSPSKPHPALCSKAREMAALDESIAFEYSASDELVCRADHDAGGSLAKAMHRRKDRQQQTVTTGREAAAEGEE